MPEGDRCHTCDQPIEMRYSVDGARSKSQGFWAHLDTVEGIAADEDHSAVR
jgi:hypothetical protein